MRKKTKTLPTLFGILILLFTLALGIFAFQNKGLNIFIPKANEDITPFDVQVVNLKDTSATIVFRTKTPTIGIVHYGDSDRRLKFQVRDVRNQFYDKSEKYKIHFVTISDLNPDTTYYFTIETDNGSIFYKNEKKQPFEFKTYPMNLNHIKGLTVYGNVYDKFNAPAVDSLVIAKIGNSEKLATLVRDSGTFAISLADVRDENGQIMNITEDMDIEFTFIEPNTDEKVSKIAKVKDAQPLEDIKIVDKQDLSSTLQTEIDTASESSESAITNETSKDETINSTQEVKDEEVKGVSTSSEDEVLDLTQDIIGQPSLEDNTPIIKGKASANSEVKVVIHSDEVIETEVKADDNGIFTIDLSSLGKSLEPGEHEITYTYYDPSLGFDVEKTYKFYVDEGKAILAQTETPTYGSDNPYVATPTPDRTMEESYADESTPTPTSIPTRVPTRAPTRAPTTRPTSLPESGIMDNTLFGVFVGFGSLILGAVLLYLNKEEKLEVEDSDFDIKL